MELSAAATRPRALEAVAEPDDRVVEQQCNHFSIREYVASLQKKDPELYSLSRIFGKQQQRDEHHNLCLTSVPKFRRWNCSGCLEKVKIGDRTTSITVSTKRASNNDGCSISFVRTVRPTSAGHTKLYPCTQRSSQGNEAGGSAFPKSTLECNSKSNSPSGSKGALTEMNVDPATKESQEAPNSLNAVENISNDASVDVSILPDIPQVISSTAENGTKEIQELPNNLDVENTLNRASVDVSILPDISQMTSSATENGAKELQGPSGTLDVTASIFIDVRMDESPGAPPQMISSKAENGTQNLSRSKSCDGRNEDENERIDVLNGQCTAPNVANPTENKGPGRSEHNGSQVDNMGSRQSASKRNAGSCSKKKKSVSTNLRSISGLKFCQRKRKRTRRLSELIETDQIGGPVNSIDADHPRVDDLHENDKGNISSEVEKDNGTTISNQKAEEIQSRTIQNNTKLRADDVDDQSSLMNWLKKSHKKVRSEKKDSGNRNVDSSVVSNSTLGILSSENLHQDFLHSAGDCSQENVPSTTNAKPGSSDMQNHSQGPHMLMEDAAWQNEPGNPQKMSLSKGESEFLLKRKVPATVNAKNGGAKSENRIAKKKMRKASQTASENPQKRRCLSKVSLAKCDTHNVSDTHTQKMATNKKKQKLRVLEKQTDIDDIPMDVVELLARHQRERQLMTDADSLETSHTQAKISTEGCAQMAANDGPMDASTVLDTNFQESLTSERKQKLPGHASSSSKAANVHPLEEPYAQMSVQVHAVSNTEAYDRQLQNSFPVRAIPITQAVHVYPPKQRIPDILMCTEERQPHSRVDNEVTIACVSPTFSHQDVAEVPSQSLGINRAKKLMWDSFKTASRNSSAPSYVAPFRSGFQEVGSAPTRVFGASNIYPTYPAASVDHFTKKAVNQAPLRNQAMEAGRLLYNQRIAGQSGLYPRETMPASHLLRLMDSSSASGFINRNRMTFEASASQYVQNQYKASPSTSHEIEKFPLTMEDLSQHQVQQNLHQPLRPHPRVGVLGSLLQQDIAKWSEHCGTHTGYRPGVSNGIAPTGVNRKENCEAWNSGMLSARWNALQSAANPDSEAQSWTKGTGKVVHPLDKLVRQDICQTNRNPADFTTISDKNEYMINL